LLRRYVELAPDAADREHVLADIMAETPPKPTTKAMLNNAWIKLRMSIRLRSRMRTAVGKFRD
jgi:hypothetical protein